MLITAVNGDTILHDTLANTQFSTSEGKSLQKRRQFHHKSTTKLNKSKQ